MEKTISIDGKDIPFKSSGATVLRYKAQFGKDFFVEILKLSSLKKLFNDKQKEQKSASGDNEEVEGLDDFKINPADLEHIDFDVLFNIAWVLAKTADKSIPDPMTWLDEFDEFPLYEIIPELQDLISSTISGKKKKLTPK